MSESNILSNIMKSIGSLPFLRIWRNNTGCLWAGNHVVKFNKKATYNLVVDKGDILIRNAHPVRFGLPGAADIIGIVAPAGRLLAIEVKNKKGKQSVQQEHFENMINAMGGIYIVAHSEEEALKKIYAATEQQNGGKARL